MNITPDKIWNWISSRNVGFGSLSREARMVRLATKIEAKKTQAQELRNTIAKLRGQNGSTKDPWTSKQMAMRIESKRLGVETDKLLRRYAILRERQLRAKARKEHNRKMARDARRTAREGFGGLWRGYIDKIKTELFNAKIAVKMAGESKNPKMNRFFTRITAYTRFGVSVFIGTIASLLTGFVALVETGGLTILQLLYRLITTVVSFLFKWLINLLDIALGAIGLIVVLLVEALVFLIKTPVLGLLHFGASRREKRANAVQTDDHPLAEPGAAPAAA